ncbi:zinc finger protein 432-like [Calliphora vicina]|uniref:zinc finger protein 432-like n=1 Tax=Calliphora vicina TaxID=7373 RepID=UPI00325B378E
MGTQIQNIQDYTSYIKCGEILRSPLKNYQNSIILKCFECKEVHFILESFITHIQEHFKDVLSLEEHDTKTQFENVHDVEMESEGVGIEHLAIKLEELEDPLFPVKSEIDEEKSKTNVETISKDLTTCIKSYDVENLDEFEDVFDSPDEFQPDDDDTDLDEDYVIKSHTNKRKKKSDDSETDEDEVNLKVRKARTTRRKNKAEDSETETDEVIKAPTNRRKKNSTESKPDDSETDDGDDEFKKEMQNKKNVKLSPFVDEFMKSKKNVLALIELYKKQPNLWDKYAPFYRLKDKKKQYLEEITQDLNKMCSLELSWDETAEIISHINAKHRDNFKRMHYQNNKKKETKGKKSNKKPSKYERKPEKKVKLCWFYDDLHFLRSKVIIRMQHLDTNLPDLTLEQIKEILKIYEGFPNLWNTHLIENICLNKRNDAIDEMLKALESNMNLKIDGCTLERYLHTIHEYCSREKRRRLGISTPEDLQHTKKDNSPNYYEHMTFLEDHEGPFNCSECSGIYTKPLCYRIHKSQHDGSAALKCSQCDQEFKTVASYTTHAKRHLEDLQFICKICNMKFLRHSDLKIHLLTHTDARPYCCEICGASYRQSNSFRKHQRQHQKRFSHTCHICSKGYYTKYRYVDHMNSHMNIRSHVCNICGKGFITSRALKTHAVTHEDARNHACKLCGKTFKLKIGVLQHMRTHGSKVETEKNSLII